MGHRCPFDRRVWLEIDGPGLDRFCSSGQGHPFFCRKDSCAPGTRFCLKGTVSDNSSAAAQASQKIRPGFSSPLGSFDSLQASPFTEVVVVVVLFDTSRAASPGFRTPPLKEGSKGTHFG